MAKVPFKYYLHDSSFRESFEWVLKNQDLEVEMTEDLWQKIGRPFYEVTLQCELDTETGEVEILSAR